MGCALLAAWTLAALSFGNAVGGQPPVHGIPHLLPQADPSLRSYQVALETAQREIAATQKEIEALRVEAAAEPENLEALRFRLVDILRSASKAGERTVGNLAVVQVPPRLERFHLTLIEANQRLNWAFAKTARWVDEEGLEGKRAQAAMNELQRLAAAFSRRMIKELNRAGYTIDAQGNLVRTRLPRAHAGAQPPPPRLTLSAYNAALRKSSESIETIAEESGRFQQDVAAMAEANPAAIQSKATAFVGRMQRKYNAFLASLRALRPPADLDAFHATFVEGVTELGTVFVDLSAAMATMDHEAVVAAQAKAQRIESRIIPRIERAATAAGYRMGPRGLEKARAKVAPRRMRRKRGGRRGRTPRAAILAGVSPA